MSEQNRQCSDTGCDKTSCESCDHANTAINFSAPLHEMSTVKKVIGIVSGKGGVGKFYRHFAFGCSHAESG